MSEIKNQVPRRKFLKGAAAGSVGAAALGFPMISKAQQTITMRFQSTWPTKDIFHEYANDYAAKVNAMSGGRLKIEVLPAGSVVKAFDLLDAVSSGTCGMMWRGPLGGGRAWRTEARRGMRLRQRTLK
jgi:TRAP-type mannitol/chloroaromatic compound transport system substrate-binding protein